MSSTNGSRFRSTRTFWILLLIILIATPISLVTAQQGLFDRQSPATGHAQVVTQGISELPEGEVVWRLVERSARPREFAKPGNRVLGFILATEDPVLLSNVNDAGELEDVARLAPGESYLVKGGTRQVRASMGENSVTYLAYELVPAEDADDTNGGTLLFVSDPFVAPSGARDIDLVRNVLEEGETATLPNTGESVAILATEGAIDILPSGGRGRTIEAGEGAIFEPGELEIEAVTPTASAGGVRAQIAMFTSSLQDDDEVGAAYVVAVIGPEIPPAPTVEPTETPVPIPTVSPTISAPEVGSISVTVFDCPEGMTIENLVHDGCELSTAPFELLLVSQRTQQEWRLSDAADLGGTWVWKDLPLGDYGLHELVVPEPFNTYFIPGSAAVFGSADGGYLVTIDSSAPDIILALYHLRPSLETGSISVNLYLCPQGETPDDYTFSNCGQATGGFEIRLVSVDSGEEFTMADGLASGASISWSGLRIGAYQVIVDVLPGNWYQYIGPDGNVYTEGSGGVVEIGGAFSPDAFLDLPAFQE